MPKTVSNAQLDALLETIARRFEDRTEPIKPEEAAQIVRESKTKIPPTNK